MIKAFSFQKKYAADRGVALLFALGILSALMLLGIAFMGSSLFSRRIAENRSNGNEARLLARSTANLVAGAVMMYEAEIARVGVIRPNDYSGIFSRVNNTASSPVYDELLRGYSPASDLSGYSRLDVQRRNPYAGADSVAQWVYVHDSDGNIIGRYAYQVLPQPTLHRINMHHMLSRNQGVSQWPRYGQDIAELGLDIVDQTNVVTIANSTRIPAYFSDLLSANLALDASNLASDASNLTQIQENFLEGMVPCVRELAPGDYQRFNLAAWTTGDPWFARFMKNNSSFQNPANNNATNFLDDLTEPRPAVLNSNNYDDILYDTGVNNSNRVPGLAFLRVIGDNPGSFDNLTDLRHQIAANFNDYCDSDPIPTSDVPASDWSPNNAPTYTGNERTLYLNEIFYSVVGTFSPNTTNRGLLDFSADLIWGAELIDIYGNQNASGNISASGYRLDGGIQSATIVMDISANIQYQYTVDGPNGSTHLSGTDTVSTNNFTTTWNGSSQSINNFSEGAAYKIGAVTIANTTASWDFGSLLEPIIRNSPAYTSQFGNTSYPIRFTSAQISLTSLTITSCTINPENMVLKIGSDPVDYTNVNLNNQNASITPAADVTVSATLQVGNNNAPNDVNTLRLFIGGMEAKDPRQNLNARGVNATGNATDWNWNPQLIAFNNNSELSASGATIDSGGATFFSSYTTPTMISEIISQPGRVNSGLPLPNSSNSYDCETVSDPGWSINNSISTAVIRDAPMVSPWELGFIHRGAPFQTINLKRVPASGNGYTRIPSSIDNTPGVSYADGDGAILDWIKMTDCSHSYGKVNMRQFFDQITEFDQNLLQVLFGDLPQDSAADFVRDTNSNSYTPNPGNTNISSLQTQLTGMSQLMRDNMDRRSKLLNLGSSGSSNGIFATLENGQDDASQERLIGRTFNLITVNAVPRSNGTVDDTNREQSSQVEPPAVFYAVIIAQTIKDVGGGTAVSSDHPEAVPRPAQFGEFNVTSQSNSKDNIHYDVITGEAKILVTYERNPVTGQVIIRDIENIE